MERKLKRLFDYQRFEKNDNLEKLIKETERCYRKELSDEDLLLVNAAGEFDMSGEMISDPPGSSSKRPLRSIAKNMAEKEKPSVDAAKEDGDAYSQSASCNSGTVR